MYEVPNTDSDFNPATGILENTDNDAWPNYLDNDDDGDTVLTIYESNNSDNDQNPNTGIPLDTDGDGIPNYLDVDDDNDGYATWEPVETDNTTDNDGNPLTNPHDSDNDGIVSHLDPNEAVYPIADDPVSNALTNFAGDKRYELANHLGNVLVVVSDKKIPFLSSSNTLINWSSEIISYSDYDPFGSLLPGRHGSLAGYRYGFQGQEKDDEVKGEGNSLNYTFRMHDPKLGRFFAVDPLTAKYPFYSPYQFSGNRVIDMVELEGLEPTFSEAAALAKDGYNPGKEKLPGDWKYDDSYNGYLNITNKETGFSSALYSRLKGKEKEYVFVTTGTDDTNDIIEDILEPMGYSAQVLHSINNAKELNNQLGMNANITYVGHSLGGALASANALATGDYAITFNAAALSKSVKSFYSLTKKAKIDAFIVEGEVVDKMQSLIGLKAEGIIHKIPDFQSLPSKVFEDSLPFPLSSGYDSMRSIQKHMIGTVIEYLAKMNDSK